MGQGLGCCECLYYNQCHTCMGLSVGMLCCGCWMCAPQGINDLRGPNCCQFGCNQGYGGSCFCVSAYYCAP